MMIIIVLTAILTLLVKMIGGNKFSHMPFIQNLFDVNTVWVITRIVATVFAVMVKFKLGTEAIYSKDTGKIILGDLLHTLFEVLIYTGLCLSLLRHYDFLDFFILYVSVIFL